MAIEVIAIVLAVVCIAAAIGLIVLMAKLSGSRATQLQAQTDLQKAVDANTGYVTHSKELEAEISSLKAEISSLEKDLDALNDPTIVRNRLRSLLTPSPSGQTIAYRVPASTSSR